MAKPKRKRKERAERLHREPVVRRVSELLASGRPTPWRWTSEARHGLRAGMCLDGMAWHAADARAEEIVRLARHRIGLSRCPTWTEAQGDAPEEREYWFCASCAGFMHASDRPWCSDECRMTLRERQRVETGRREDEARRHATRVILVGHADPEPVPIERSCRKCSKLFTPKPGHKHQRYCGHVCAAKKARYRTAACLVCAEPFQPWQHKQLTCGPACAWKLILKRRKDHHVARSYEKQCRSCAQPFTAARSTAVLCSPVCQRVDQRRRSQAWSQKRATAAPMAMAP